MINDIHFPKSVTGILLDDYLAQGWYRMGQIMFTTDQVIYLDNLHRVHWLRYHVPDISFTRTHKKIISANSEFIVEFKPLDISNELEDLYEVYRESIPFDPSDSVEDFLFGGSIKDIFTSQLIELRDKGKLIAAGVFDIGEKAIAGIMNFYHPEYKKFSAGKYLMLLKIQFAIKNGIEWYYPGYLMEGNPRFDYKLFIGKDIAEVFLAEEEHWIPHSSAEQWNLDLKGD